MNRKKLNYVSLFSGGGIASAELKKIGYHCICSNELIERRLNVQKLNKICKDKHAYIAGDIRDIDVRQKIHKLLKNEFIDLLIATPPCQGMSVANHKKNNMDLARNSLVLESINLIKKYKPRTFIFENVRGFLKAICTDNDKINKTIESVIKEYLSKLYNFSSKVINLGNYGSHSNRTRCLVIGSLRSNLELNPQEMFPDLVKQKTLRELISHLPKLKRMGESHKEDLLHNFKAYDPIMRYWIEKTSPGESAFDQKDKSRIPQRMVNGKKVFIKNKNSDKYKRCSWDKPMPCIHTRNDILASQATVHPSDDRVFSIRELMILMNVPNDFKWFPEQCKNSLDYTHLKKHEMNIRQCLGEGVPTIIFTSIASKIKEQILISSLTLQELNKIKETYDPSKDLDWKEFRKKFFTKYNFYELSRMIEFFNSSKTSTSAYYTRSDISKLIVRDLPAFKNKHTVRILEPSVGSGSFIPFLIDKYRNKNIILDLIDIDKSVINLLKDLLRKLDIPKNCKINLINNNFLNYKIKEKYDLVITNPPFGKTPKEILTSYEDASNVKSKNQFALFMHKALKHTDYLSFITPKSLLSTPEFDSLRCDLENYYLCSIIDFGEKAFKGVLIETISMTFNLEKKVNKLVTVKSLIDNSLSKFHQNTIQDIDLPYWLIYRTPEFDKTLSKLCMNIFTSLRDREITKRHTTNNKTPIRVIKSRNIANNKVLDIPNYDCYLRRGTKVKAIEHINTDKIIVPNLTYYPRAARLPKNCICDGSVALLTLKPGFSISDKDLEYFSTDEFKNFYSIARNKGTRSLNIDKNSIFFWGVISNRQQTLL